MSVVDDHGENFPYVLKAALSGLARPQRDHGRRDAGHLHTLNTWRNLAYWQERSSEPALAAEGLEQLLADQLRVLGPDHPDTLTTRNLAACWGLAGDPDRAVNALERLVTDRLRVLGADHRHTLVARHNPSPTRPTSVP